ncbi:MAG TPA: cytochrome c-type biogenesis protein CcmH [Aggregatilineales bacterium]|nr:cytochrome c-type biogenesis protein CcmH [Aggregatilineales bacterium]
MQYRTIQKYRFAFVMVVVGLFMLAVVMPLYAQVSGEDLPPGVTGEDVYRVASKMYCEVCQGVPISACPSPTCVAWRQEVANLIGQGYEDQEILEYFAERYGDEVTGVPLRSGQRWIALCLPALVTVMVGMLIIWQVWRLRMRGETRAYAVARAAGLRADYDRPVPDNVDSDYLERFLQLLEERK